MAIPARPRFHAIMWGQVMGVLIIVVGMSFYWFGFGGAQVPSTISWRVGAIVLVILLTVLVPVWLNSRTLRELATEETHDKEAIFDEQENVRKLLWVCLYIDLGLLTYLVHITGGLAKSMFAGTYLMLPSVALLLRVGSGDTRRVRWLTLACAGAIFLSALMSHYSWYEFDASQYPHAYDKAIGAVAMLSVFIPLAQIAIVRYQEDKATREQRTNDQPEAPF